MCSLLVRNRTLIQISGLKVLINLRIVSFLGADRIDNYEVS